MPRLRKFNRLCSRTVSDTANRLRKTRKKKILCRTQFSKRSPVSGLRQIRKQGKGRSSKRKENRRLSFLLPPAAGAANPRAPQSALLAEVQRKNSPPVRGEPACGSSCAPVSRRRKGAARQGRTRLRQFACPGQPAQKRSRPSGANPPAAVRVPRSDDAKGAAHQGRTRLRQFVCPGHLVPRKEKAPQNCFHGAQSMHFYSNRSSVSTSLRAGACGSCAG